MNKRKTSVYILLSTNQVKAYSCNKTAFRVFERAKRMGVRGLEFVSSNVRTGDRFKHATIDDVWQR